MRSFGGAAPRLPQDDKIKRKRWLQDDKHQRQEGYSPGLERLPEFDFVAVGIVDPGEAAIAFVLALRVDPDASFREAVE